MKTATLTFAAALVTASAVWAAGSGDHSHSHSHGHGQNQMMNMMKAGMPGMAENVDRTIDVIMRETDDGAMIFEPDDFEIRQGETIRFNVMNKGELNHEFVIDTPEGNVKHGQMMAAMNMEHDDPNSVRLAPGETGEIIWTFANTGSFEAACLIPGHYGSGMHGPIRVESN